MVRTKFLIMKFLFRFTLRLLLNFKGDLFLSVPIRCGNFKTVVHFEQKKYSTLAIFKKTARYNSRNVILKGSFLSPD